jgi:hypothetical protein
MTSINLTAYISKSFKETNDATVTAKNALNKLVKMKYNICVDDIPDSWDKADALSDAEQCILANNYSNAEMVLSDFLDQNGPFF